ncbi:probable F-box protein At4g22030 [Rhododendron vialii]|uniref:probable F-box protein At4g22030 n=1 Tax=Rhododendron vialii TaxID=182163 RepID=UPI00265E2D5E|nr:probable F-box protein At4g22030 [Rhododendron vialii]
MATTQASIFLSRSASPSPTPTPKVQTHRLSARKLNGQQKFHTMTKTSTERHRNRSRINTRKEAEPNIEASEELHSIMNLVADRAEMHKNIGIQRDNWNHLLLSSINGMTVTAATMAALAAVSGEGNSLLALKLSSTILYAAATGVSLVMNKIQPSQLAEEQRNASRLLKQLHEQIKSRITLRKPTSNDVKDAMERVLAIDRAYPLPLLGAMLDKFPKAVEPAVWWPKEMRNQKESFGGGRGEGRRNGWSKELEEEMRGVVGVMKRKDSAEYLRLSKLVLTVNKVLAVTGPWLTGLAAVGSALVRTPWVGSWAVVFGVVFGALATVVNTIEHGGQVGMIFEMYRSSAGFFMLMEESIESTLEERAAEERENGELFETEVALKLGRSLSELKNLASISSSFTSCSFSSNSESTEEYASKLF